MKRIATVFRRHGYEGTTMALLSQEAGLGRSSLYHHFPAGKVDMARAVLAHTRPLVRSEVGVPFPSGPGAAAPFVAALRAYYGNGRLGCILAVLALSGAPEAIKEQVAEIMGEWIAVLATRLDGDAARAERLLRHLQGGLVLALALRDTAPFEAALEEIALLIEERA